MKIKRSKKEFELAKEYIPGGVDSPVRAFKSVGGTPLFIKRARGAFIEDIDGNRYVDFVQSWGPLIFGHTNKKIEKAVCKSAKKGLSFGTPTRVETKLAKEIVKLFPNIDKVRFVSSGTEAVMSAIRVARGFTSKEDIVKFEGCYHGHSDSLLVSAGSGAATFGSPSSPGVPADLTKHTLLAKYNDIESVKKCFSDSSNIACVIIEPIAGNMGLVPANIEFLKKLRELCDENGALLIFDEVMSGFRASLRGASGIVGVEADILTFGKVIGGGMPVGAFGAKDRIMDRLSPDGDIYQAGTLSGNPVAMSAGLKSLKMIKKDEKLYTKLENLANMLMDGFKEGAKEVGLAIQTEVRGSMFGFFFNQKPVKNFDDAQRSDAKLFAKFHQEMLKEGVYLACSQYETGFICEPMDERLIKKVVKKAKKAMKKIL
jgi:glutamate-1-semialdehyde 2,1-aminomutase